MNQNLIIIKTSKKTYRYTNSTSSVIVDSFIYQTANFSVGDFTKSESLDDNKIDVIFSKNCDFAKDVENVNFLERADVEILKYDSEKNKKVVVFYGVSVSITKNMYDITVSFNSSVSELNRATIKRKYQRTCSFSLYDKDCKVSKINYLKQVNIVSIAEKTVVIDEVLLEDYYAFGYLQYNLSDDVHYIHILSNFGQELYLDAKLNENAQNVVIFPNCNKTITSCENKFNNSLNFGGFPYLPQTNPTNTAVA